MSAKIASFNKIENFNKPQLKNSLPDIRPGDIVRVSQIIRGEKSKKDDKQARTQVFEGLIIAKKHGKGVSATITVRKVVSGVGVEKIIPIHSPLIEKIEVIRRGKARRAKLYFLRTAKGRKSKLKKREIKETQETPNEKAGTAAEVIEEAGETAEQ